MLLTGNWFTTPNLVQLDRNRCSPEIQRDTLRSMLKESKTLNALLRSNLSSWQRRETHPVLIRGRPRFWPLLALMPDLLQHKAVEYVSGGMTAQERDSFEVLLEFHDALRALVADLHEVVGAIALAQPPPVAAPPVALKARVLDSLATPQGPTEPEGLVATDPSGRSQWVNAEFTAMCGYSLGELKGRKPGQVLQGPDTDPAAVERIRAALRAGGACRETLVNYHKDGTRYRAEVNIAAILGDDEKPLWFVARERKLRNADAMFTR